jgi:hypothetical protein
LCVGYANSLNIRREKPEVPYPENFRQWRHIKSGLIEPKSKAFGQFGGFHHIYANKEAIRGYESGTFPQGSILVFDKIEMIDDDSGNVSEGKRTGVDVMIKDIRYDSTGGWGYEEFTGDSKTERTTKMIVMSCYKCHSERKANDFVFSAMRK